MKHYLSYLREFRQALLHRFVIFNGARLRRVACVRAVWQ